MNQDMYLKIMDALVEDGYIVLKDALSKELCSSLLQDAQNQKSFKSAGISSTNKLHIDRSKRSDKTIWLDEDGGAKSEYLMFSAELRDKLNQELYLGIKYYEAHYALYEEGDFYEKHLDAFKGSKNRVVTTVLYLNEEWDESKGGELIVYNQEDEKIAKVIPNAGTLVVFLSDKFPHEVLPAKVKRHSIAGWFRIDK